MDNVTIFDHPLITNKLAIMRDEKTGSKEFRELVEEVAMLMAFEALRDIKTKEIDVKTPIAVTKTRVIAKTCNILFFAQVLDGNASGTCSTAKSATSIIRDTRRLNQRVLLHCPKISPNGKF